jgi:tetratricopeptide (TPR) repeat protein
MSEPTNPQFLDVPTLLENSQRRWAGVRLWQVVGVFLLVSMMGAYLSSRGPETAQLMNILSGMLMVGLVIVLAILTVVLVRKARGEQLTLESIEELIRLRRWPEAGMLLDRLLSRPTRTPQARVQGLIFLTGVLARYNRFDEAIAVQNYLLENVPVDGGTYHGLTLARAMAMLRQDHLFDADRAINELRQQVSRAGRAARSDDTTGEITEAQTPQSLSAGLALIELYRDVKTGHPAEAIELFNATLPSLRDQLGHRVADTYVLVAKAYDLLGRDAEAQSHFEKATLLASPEELFRRFPECAQLGAKYRPAERPKDSTA